jgi:hypothetical protein
MLAIVVSGPENPTRFELRCELVGPSDPLQTEREKTMTSEEKLGALLAALDEVEWRSVGYRLGPFFPWMADELVGRGLAERRERSRKSVPMNTAG